METNFAVVNKYLGGGVVQAISARELHTFLESKQDFSTWVKKRLDDCCALEEQDYTRVHKKMEANNVLPPIKGGFFYGVLLCLIA